MAYFTFCTYPLFLFGHLKIYVWSPLVNIPFGRYGLYPASEEAGISPDFVLNFLDSKYQQILNSLP